MLAGCGDGEDTSADRAHRPEAEAVEKRGADAVARARLEPARCPANATNCEAASGTIIYVERADPDGDGDAHFVLASSDGITAPGISVIDVRKDLRPEPLPGPGERISAAGPVYSGSYGQRQIQAEVVNVDRP